MLSTHLPPPHSLKKLRVAAAVVVGVAVRDHYCCLNLAWLDSLVSKADAQATYTSAPLSTAMMTMKMSSRKYSESLYLLIVVLAVIVVTALAVVGVCVFEIANLHVGGAFAGVVVVAVVVIVRKNWRRRTYLCHSLFAFVAVAAADCKILAVAVVVVWKK